MRNSFVRFEEDSIVNVAKSKDPKIPPRIQLDPFWRPSREPETGALQPDGKLWEFIEKIASSRREGKNRRDGATVSSRVLKLADTLGRKIFEEAGRKEISRLNQEEQESVKRSLKEKKQRRSGKKKVQARPKL